MLMRQAVVIAVIVLSACAQQPVPPLGGLGTLAKGVGTTAHKSLMAASPTDFGPPWVTGQSDTGVGWTGCVDYEPGRDGSGCFIQFLSNSRSGKQVSGITLNGGIWDATPGREQGDLDIGIIVNGQGGYIISFTNLGIGVSQTDWAAIGNTYGRFREIWLTPVPCPSSVPGQPSECVRVNGGYTGVYR